VVQLPAHLLSCTPQLNFKPKKYYYNNGLSVILLCGSYFEIWCKVVYLVDYLLVEPSFSIYKTTLKSKSSINEVNQVAQVFFNIHISYITLNILLFVK
jgi:hypothetical protein